MVPLKLNIDSSFFDEEDSCGFHVTKQRKELWAVELDLLAKFDQVCKNNGLKYCVGAGTMLGAVRHQGFIPWDDDIDIYMPREDYDKLVNLSDLFDFPYFLQNAYTEKNLLKSFSKLRNSQTTGSTETESKRYVNNGIFIDIFPLDGISSSGLLDRKQSIVNKVYKNFFRWYNYSLSSRSNARPQRRIAAIKLRIRKMLVKLFVRDKERFFQKFEKNLKKYSKEGTVLWGNRTIVFECPKSRRPISDYMDTINMPFEFLEVPVPRNYDEMLRQQYGDYMKIPEKKGENMHGELNVSTEYAYDDPRRILNK